MHPVGLCDHLKFERTGTGLQLTCSDPQLPVDGTNLVYRAAAAFLAAAGIKDGVKIHLEKRIPMAAGLGGGSGNAANTLLGLNELFQQPLVEAKLYEIAAALGSDIPFFLQSKPALGIGRGERIESLERFELLRGRYIFLIHPGFGIATAWAYQQLARFPEALHGRAGRARELIGHLQQGSTTAAWGSFYNSLEAPALDKYPVLKLYQEFMRANGADVALMSGSGSTTFAITKDLSTGESLCEKFKGRFGATCWTAVVPL